jgi:hypothetical protein
VVYKIVLERNCGQRTNDKTLQSQIQFMVGRAFGGPRGSSWDSKISPIKATKKGAQWNFKATVSFEKISGRKDAEQKQWLEILKFFVQAGIHTKFGLYKWIPLSGHEALNKNEDNIHPLKVKNIKDYGEVGVEINGHFDRIYDREHQINIIHSAVIAAKKSDFTNRFHCVLHGPPGCGKSDILLSVGNMLGNENDAYMKFDATSTTEAGASRILLEADYIPPVLIVEEIEKTDEKSLRWMLGILDQRAEIRRTNFRIGNRARNVKMLCLATVNDMDLFRRAMSGALSSRFAHEIYCPRPSREVMRLILEREVKKVKGKMKWIDPTLKFCYDEQGWDDPRKVIPICLCGRESLMDGSYQKSILETRREERQKNEGTV